MPATATNTLHYAQIHKTPFKHQPTKELGFITNDFKRIGHSKRVDIESIFKYASNGHCLLLSNYETNNNNIRFISSSLIAIDVDDDDKVTDPLEVLEELKSICTGLFYTFSHELKGNRYRLVFQLDKPVTDEQEHKILVDYLLKHLKEKGLPVDTKAGSPTQIVRGGNKGYIIKNTDITLKTGEWLPKAKEYYKDRIKAFELKRSKLLSDSMNNPVTYEQLLEMCNIIGHLPSKTSDEITQQWLQVVYALKHCVNMQFIDDQQGYELFNIVSGGESNEKYWNSLKPSGHVTVATIIHYAKQRGYEHKATYSHALKNTPAVIETERISNKGYIQTKTMIELLQREQKLLVESSTGSGKTTATMNAFKRFAESGEGYYIFSVPTIVLAEQVAKEHDVTCIKGGIKHVHQSIRENIQKGKRIFVCTYDKTSELMEYVNRYNNHNAKFYVVVDEIHKYTEAYNYRYVTIDRIEDISEFTASFIGLTGTPADILKDRFDKQIIIDTGNDRSPLTDFRVFTYNKLNDKTNVIDGANVLLTSVIRSVLKQTRLIVFINNKERIQTISRLLRKEDIKHAIITSDKKQSSTYRDIVNTGMIDDDVQVILTTSVLSDGITIRNNLDWSCLVVSDRQSLIFNPSTIKQISNRFRNQYRYFLLFIRTPNEEYNETRKFNIEADYNYKLNVTRNYVEYLNNEYEGDYSEFVPSKVERNNGIYYRSTEDNATIKYNPLFLRHNAMKDKETYYMTHRNAFIKEVSRMIGKQETGIFNVNEELERNGSDLTGLLEEVETEKEEQAKSNEELRSNFPFFFTKDVYLSILHNDDVQTIEYFKANVHSDIVSTMFKIVKIADYETSLQVGKSVKRRSDINSFYNDIEALSHVAVFKHTQKRTITKSIYMQLEKITGKEYLTNEFKDVTEKELPKKVTVNKRRATIKDVREVLKMFNHVKSRNKRERFTSIEPLTIEAVAEKYGITTQQVKNSILLYVENQPKQRRKIMMESIKKEYGI